MNYPNKLTIEIDITHRCNLHCRHCNRLCNAESMYGVVREHKDTKTRSHTDNFGENNVKCLIAKGICRFVPHSSAGGF